MKNSAALLLGSVAFMVMCPATSYNQNIQVQPSEQARLHHEVPNQPYLAYPAGPKKTSPAYRANSSGFFTRQVNVDSIGNNIIGDAANEPSIAVDPTNPDKMIIGWRQFDNVNSDFRQAGYGYSSDGGQNWTFPGVLEPTVFRSDPVLDFDSAGNFFYNSLTNVTGAYTCRVFKSTNGGAAWDPGTDAYGGDKQWMTIDRTAGPGSGNIYSFWTIYYSSCQPGMFTRSADAGTSYESCVGVDGYPYWGTMVVGSEGELYIAGALSSNGIVCSKSTNAQIPGSVISWVSSSYVDLDGGVVSGDPVNPVGLVGQVSVDVDRSGGPGQGNVYVLASVERFSVSDPADVMFAKSTDGGFSFSAPQRINNDASTGNRQWFGTMSVAPNGRIDVIWLDTRGEGPGSLLSALYYCYSEDQGETWSINKQISNQFDPSVGYPQQQKMGDYFDMVSDNEGAHLAWANTLNGEEDVYYTHIIPTIVGIGDNPEVQMPVSLNINPNPFTDQTTIHYTVRRDCDIKIVICNIYGEVIRTLVDKNQKAGKYSADISDHTMPAGFYLCRISAGTQSVTSRMIRVN